MVAQSSIFPIFLRAEYREEANGIPKFISRVQQAAKISEAKLTRVGAALNKALTAPRTGSGALNLGTAELREQIRAQEQAAVAAREVANATKQVAINNSELARGLVPSIRAYFGVAQAKDADAKASRAQLAALQLVEAELTKGTRAVQARLQAEQQLANFRKTATLNEGALRVARGEAAIDRAALSGATLEGVLGRVNRGGNADVARQRAQEAAATQQLARANEELASSAARLNAQIDPLAAAQQRYDATLAEASRLLQAGAISTQQFAQAQAFASTQLREAGRAIIGVTEAEKRRAQAAQEALAAQQAYNASLAQLRASINPAAAAQEEFNRRVAFAQQALDRGELSQQEYARAVQLASATLRQAGQAEVAATAARNGLTQATKVGTTAQNNVINSVRSSRTAYIQLGQQLQDATVQAQLGTSAFVIFSQQVPQAAFALSGLAGSANRAQARIGALATFLAGPWGAAIFAGTAILGPLVQKLFESADAADASGRAQRSLTEVLADTTSSYQEVTEALRDYSREQERSREVTLSSLSAQAAQIASNLRVAVSIREKIKAELELFQSQVRAGPTGPGGQGQIGALAGASVLAGELAKQDALIGSLTESSKDTTVEVARAIADVQSDAAAGIREGFKILRTEAEESITDVKALTARLTTLRQQENAALEAERKSVRKPRSDQSAEIAAREQAQLAKFGESAAESIRRINERFDEQPRLIDTAAQATRQLDEIIADLEKRKPANFEKLVEDAQAAQRTIEDALVRPFELLRQESENRVAIERALAAGREDEAVALQEVFRLEQQIGPLTADQKQDVEDIVRLERQRIILLRDQQALFNAQLDVVQTVRRDLTDLLSGRSADFFGNFRQALQDLQGQRLFEDLFGDSFRAIEEQLRADTPQGKANAAYTANVNETAATTKVLETALDDLAVAVNTTRDRLLSDFDTEFARAANDNTVYQGQITVPGKRVTDRPEVEIARVSVNELAERIARGVSDPIKNVLEDVLGPRFAGVFGDIVGGAIKGQVLGGGAGAVFGGFEGLFASGILGNDNRLTGRAAAGVEGAARGTQIAGLSKLLGLGGSTSGAQIGGGLGGVATAITGVPGLDIAGAVIGNFLGKLINGTPRGSATIGGVGGALGITGTRGNSGSREQAASGLADSVLDAIDDIARQLGASVDAARGSVSIGVRNDNLRVDTTGRGITKTDNGAIDFGDDTEAAIAFAVRDLINDGVITGLRQAEQNLIRAGKDIEQSLRDVLTFRSVFDRLQEIKDPLGFAIGQLNREFEGLIDLFERAGASTEEFASLEELYNLERARAIEDATDRVAGSLKQLLADLTIGDSGLSLRDRRANALGQFNSLAGRVAAGDSSAFDDFAEVSQQLLDIERQLFGSTQSYFDRLAEITRLTEAAIADQTNVVSIGSSAPSPFGDPIRVDRSIDIMNGNLGDKLDTLNSNVVTLSEALLRSPGFSGGGSFDGGVIASRVLNF